MEYNDEIKDVLALSKGNTNLWDDENFNRLIIAVMEISNIENPWMQHVQINEKNEYFKKIGKAVIEKDFNFLNSSEIFETFSPYLNIEDVRYIIEKWMSEPYPEFYGNVAVDNLPLEEKQNFLKDERLIRIGKAFYEKDLEFFEVIKEEITKEPKLIKERKIR